ncbi:MAG: MBL fold metallo-hydrolase [Planctomycetes bacterium]|nr:MBL fold metallo-hydrolase [Planctomycetota bacterium]
MRGTRILELSDEVAAVHCVGALSNSYAVATDAGAYLVDAGIDPRGTAMLAALEVLGRAPADLTAIYLTHWHNDHTAGAAHLRATTPARVWYPEGERAHFTARAAAPWRAWLAAHTPELGPLSVLKGLVGASPPRAVEADAHPRHGETLPHGVVALHTPGHTPHHFAYWDPRRAALFAGDALAVCGGRLSFMSRYLTDDLGEARASYRALLDLDAALVCPGHRAPLAQGVAAERARLRASLDAGARWPWFS